VLDARTLTVIANIVDLALNQPRAVRLTRYSGAATPRSGSPTIP